MGNPSRPDLHPRVLEWAKCYRGGVKESPLKIGSSSLNSIFESDLREYFRLCGLSRSRTAIPEYVEGAVAHVFRVRAALEKAMATAISQADLPTEQKIQGILSNSFFGFSKKQGTSLRMPLTTCTPTQMCGAACYAHDVLDATPGAMIRGAMNGWLAGAYETGDSSTREDIMRKLIPHCRSAIRKAQGELKNLPEGYKRRAFIRFSHVGEIVYFPDFANALARQVRGQSLGEVDCVVYTRHRNVVKLDPELWIINFTLDPSSMDRRSWAPPNARIVFSAFGGMTSDVAEVNFLEHHRHGHTARTAGTGRVCPATAPETKVRTCDACHCNRCFVPPSSNRATKRTM
jgi:hypothetical protein